MKRRAPHDGPIAHLIAAEDEPRHAARVEHQDSARREQQVIDVNESAHAVGHQHLMRRLVGDSIQARQQRLAARPALIGADADIAAGPDQHAAPRRPQSIAARFEGRSFERRGQRLERGRQVQHVLRQLEQPAERARERRPACR